MYETGRTYHPEKKYNIPDRVTIGKICENEEGKMYPNEKFNTYFPDVQMPESDNRLERSSCLRIGRFLVIKKLLMDSGVKDMIEEWFPLDCGLLSDMVAYSIIMENNAAQYYPDYAYNHPLFTPDYKIYSDTKISSFLKNVTDDQRLGFLDKWNEEREHDKNIQAGAMEIAEFGHAKDDSAKPIVNISVGYDHDNREPLFYEEYPGSIVDVSQLKYMVDKAVGYGYRKVGFVLDRGYFSRENLNYLDENRMPFVIMAKGNANFINGLVKEV